MRKGIAFAALDLMGSLLLVVYVLVNPPVIEAQSSIATPGKWVITATWEASDNDLDLWLREPNGRKVFWRNPRSPSSHLEQDDLGFRDDSEGDNIERLVIRNIQAGEHVVAIHAFAAYDTPIAVTVTLWRLQGVDKKVGTVRLVFTVNGSEQTAFRMTLDEAGLLTDLNYLPAEIVG